MSDYESDSRASSDSESSMVESSFAAKKKTPATQTKKNADVDEVFGSDVEDSGSEVSESENNGSDDDSSSIDNDDEMDELPDDDELFGAEMDEERTNKPAKPIKANKPNKPTKSDKPHLENELEQLYLNESDYSDDEDEEDPYGEEYLQKFDNTIRDAIMENHHKELLHHNYEEIEALMTVVRDERGIIIDPLHRTTPILTKYERARILGERAKQLNAGAKPFVPIKEGVIDGYLIACSELEQKKIPFIIRRPINGGFEYWKLKDLEII